MNIKKLFPLFIFFCSLTLLHLHAAADKPIIVFAKGPLRHTECRTKFTITPEAVQAEWVATGAILPILSTAKILTIGRSAPDKLDVNISVDPRAPIDIYTTRIEISATGVKVYSYDYNGDLHSKTTQWCGCITTWFAPHRGIADPEELHKCAACKKKEADAQYAADLKAIDRLIEKQNEDMESWLLR